MSKKIILSFAVFLLFLNFLCWQEVFALNARGIMAVSFLDVGQGDSVFIETPQKHHIVIDGGPGSLALQKISSLLPFWQKSIDLVILTHPESDHMQGLFNILQRYKAEYILWTGIEKTTPEYEKWSEALSEQEKMGAKIIIASSGQEIKAGNVLIETLYPAEDLEGKKLKESSNDTCIVSKLIFNSNSFLFAGDISLNVEKKLAKAKIDLQSDVLKVSHHGSKYSTSDLFLSLANPKIAVISVGANNSYGHPTSEVLQRLDNFGIKVLRTDINNDIKIVSDGKNINIIKN